MPASRARNWETEPVRIAVVDDSIFVREAVRRLLRGEARTQVVGIAGSGEELLHHLDDWRPEVVTLDLEMPGMGGLATLDRLKAVGCRTIIFSAHGQQGAPMTIEALHRGADDFIDKQSYSAVDFEALRAVLLEKIFQVLAVETADKEELEVSPKPMAPEIEAPGQYDLVAIGASTGGPPALQTLLERLGGSFPVPVVVVQHMPVGFTAAFAERLDRHLPLTVLEARSQDLLLPKHVYVAPAGRHMRIRCDGRGLYAHLSQRPRGAAHTPSIDVLFHSAAVSVGRRALGVLLTGMGRDGADGMAALRDEGAFTLAQDPESCAVAGLPNAARARRAVCETASPPELGKRLLSLAQPSS